MKGAGVEKSENGAAKRLPRLVWAAGWVSFLTDMASEMIYPLLPSFISKSLGAGVVWVGVIEGVAETTASLTKLVSGWLSDRIRRRTVFMAVGYGIASLVRPLIALAAVGWHVLALRFADRIGKGVRGAPRDALIADATPEDRWGKAFGLQRAMDHAGAVIGPLVAYLLLSVALGERAVFALAVVPGLLCLFVIALFVRDPRSARAKPRSPSGRQILAANLLRTDPGFRGFLATIAVFTLGNSTDAFLLLRAQDLGVSLQHIPLLWAAFHVVKSATSVPCGVLSDRVGRKRVLTTGWILYALVYLGFAIAESAFWVWVLFVVYGVFYGFTEGAEKALVADLVPAERRGEAYGLYNFALGIMALPASLLLGFVWQGTGSALAAFSVGALLALAATVLLWTVVPPRRASG